MSRLLAHVSDLGALDLLAAQKTWIHTRDPRIKLITTIVFIVTVLSFHRLAVARLLPFFVYPVFLCGVGNIPILYVLKKIAVVAPFILMIGIANPYLEPSPALEIGPVILSQGWMSFFSILVRFVLTAWVALALIATTGMHQVCAAMIALKIPSVFAVQLLFLYRYIFVIAKEGIRVLRAKSLRAPKPAKPSLRTYAAIVGQLLIRTFDRGTRIHTAMICRGFEGSIQPIYTPKIQLMDMVFVALFISFFLCARFVDVPGYLGEYALELMG
ncbi:MAG: cobalt ECF transporter T component CbiQ [Myxococcota bacterium]|nr:cobalt ECF transporter T component CbiQ [Myxococcota bacterium]